jgi:Tfp pilus assembly protein PilO
MIQGQIPVPPDIPFDPNFDPSMVLGPHGGEVIMMIVLAGLAACTIILWPIMRALGRRMEHKAGPDPMLKAEVEHLHQRLAELEPLQSRVAELEERLDFTERLLAQSKDSERLAR